MMESLRVWSMQEPPYVRIPRGSSPVAGIGVCVDCRGQVGFFVPADRFKIISFSIIPRVDPHIRFPGSRPHGHADETEDRGLRNRVRSFSQYITSHPSPVSGGLSYQDETGVVI